jgi:hypothetical protein
MLSIITGLLEMVALNLGICLGEVLFPDPFLPTLFGRGIIYLFFVYFKDVHHYADDIEFYENDLKLFFWGGLFITLMPYEQVN